MSAVLIPPAVRQQSIAEAAEDLVAALTASAAADHASDSPRTLRVVAMANGLQSLLAAAVRTAGLTPDEAVSAAEHLTAWVVSAYPTRHRADLSEDMRKRSLAMTGDYDRLPSTNDFETKGNA